MLAVLLAFGAAVETGTPSDPEAYFRRALEKVRPLGQQDPQFAIAAHELAGVLLDKLKSQEAKDLLEAALPALEASFGPDDHSVAVCRFRLAKSYAQLGRYVEAEPLLLRSQETMQRAFGERDRQFVTVLMELGQLYRFTGRCEESEKVLARALSIQESLGKPDEPLTNQNRVLLGATYECLGRYTQAVAVLRRSLSVWEKHPPQPALAAVLVHFGNSQFVLRQLDKAEKAWLRASVILESFPEACMLRANVLTKLGALRLEQHKETEAEPLFLEALAITENGPDPVGNSVPILMLLANLYANRGDLDQAEGVFEKALDRAIATAGPEHQRTAQILRGLGRLRIRQARLGEADAFFRRALEIDERTIGRRHPYYGEHLDEYAALLRTMKRKKEAKELEARAKSIAVENRVNTLPGFTIDARDLQRH